MQFIREEVISGRGSREEKLIDPASPPYEAYVVDYDLFHILFVGISPWGRGCRADELSARLFRVKFISSVMHYVMIYLFLLYIGIFLSYKQLYN